MTDDIRLGRRKMRLTRLPNFLALHLRRFSRNNFFVEKNPTLATFPVRGLDLRDAAPSLGGDAGACACARARPACVFV